MISHERVAENVYAFQSDTYAQVNAGVIVGLNWAVLVDTLAFPEETLQIREFVEQQLEVPIRYVINTHYHADHSWGNCFFPGAMILSSSLCRQFLAERGETALQQTRKQNPGVFRQVKIVLPQMTFNHGKLGMRVGKKTISIIPFPGHSPDGIGVLIEEDRVLFSGDVFMPLPYVVDGNLDQMVASLKQIGDIGLENVVQGHGDIVLRGEIESTIENNLEYLARVKEIVQEAARYKYPLDILRQYDVESCGKSRVLLSGMADQLHARNLVAAYQQQFGEKPVGAEDLPNL